MKIHIACFITWLVAVISAYPIVRWEDKIVGMATNSTAPQSRIVSTCDRLNDWEIPDISRLTEAEKVK